MLANDRPRMTTEVTIVARNGKKYQPQTLYKSAIPTLPTHKLLPPQSNKQCNILIAIIVFCIYLFYDFFHIIIIWEHVKHFFPIIVFEH